MTEDKPELTIDPTGKVRYATLSYRGRHSQMRIPLHIFAIKDLQRQTTLIVQLLAKLDRKFFKEHKIKPKMPSDRTLANTPADPTSPDTLSSSTV